jgi:uncharacterized protein (TIGR00255 family)
MIHSMTSFARYEHIESWGTLTWELRSVNHRYLEPGFKMPDFARASEHLLRDKLRTGLSRGKVECALRFEKAVTKADQIALNESLLDSLIAANQHIAAKLPHVSPEFASTFLQWPGVLSTSDIDPAEMDKAILGSFDKALRQMIEHRQREGEQLEQIITQRLDAITAICASMKTLMPEIIQKQKQKLIDRFAELQLNVDQARIEQEIVFLAQKIDVDEELDRLNAHVAEVKNTLKTGGPCGRRLDFLMQELNREANTLGSKSIQSETSQISVDLKVLIEQMREQIQNIE